MTVHFIGAGPGAPDLITVRGRGLIQRCPVCLYAGSLVPAEVVAEAPAGARVLDTASMHLDEIVAEIEAAHAAGQDVARVHSGDPSLYGAIAEQIRRLDALGIGWTSRPACRPSRRRPHSGHRAYAPGVGQTVILTRTAVSVAHAERESLESSAAPAPRWPSTSRSAIWPDRARAVAALRRRLPVTVVYRATWPDEEIIRGTLADIRDQVREAKITRTALIFVGRVLGETSATAACMPPTTPRPAPRAQGPVTSAALEPIQRFFTVPTLSPRDGAGRRTMITGMFSSRAAISLG